MLIAAAPPTPMAGVNISGGEFNSGRKPGIFSKDYIYPDAKTARPFVASGMAVVRVPVLWERLQPDPMQPLSAVEIKRLDASLAQLAGFRTIILDIHNYGRLNGITLDKVDNGAAKFANLWSRLATHYASNPRVAFGLMNEPNGISASAWRTFADKGVQAIRATGAKNLILVPGTNWTGAHSWTASGPFSNAAAFASFSDPGRNAVFEMHQYLDAGNSGTQATCVDPGTIRQRMVGATSWLRRTGQKALLGEFGAAANPGCLASLSTLLDFLNDNGDVWIGWTYWAGGAWWGDRYPYNVQPGRDGAAKPQMAILARHIRSGASK